MNKKSGISALLRHVFQTNTCLESGHVPLKVFSLFVVVLAACFSLAAATAFAAEVTMSWTANDPIEQVSGYKIYYGEESRLDANQQLKENFQYDFVINLNDETRCVPGDVPHDCALISDLLQCDLDGTNPTCTYSGLEPDTKYYFTATAFNDRVESDYCQEEAYPDLNVVLLSPEDEATVPVGEVSLLCQAESETNDISYIALYSDISGEWQKDGEINSTEARQVIAEFAIDLPTAGNFTWTCKAGDVNGNIASAPPPYVFTTVENSPGPVTLILENGEEGAADQWSVVSGSDSAAVTNTFDNKIDDYVLSFAGDSSTVFNKEIPVISLSETNGPVTLSWNANSQGLFVLTIHVVLNSGEATVNYFPGEGSVADENTVWLGLGPDTSDGTWHLFTRDIGDDIRQQFGRAVELKSLDRLSVMGPGMLDNISLTQIQ